ncbi:MAG TPA: anti-sigma factor [Flavobacterium sp.]
MIDTREYIESGILELYVFGLLTEEENKHVAEIEKLNPAVHDEIVAIEKAIVALSTGFSPYLSAAAYEQIREKLALKHRDVVQLKPQKKRTSYLGWAAALLFLLGGGYLFYELNEANMQYVNLENQKKQLQERSQALEFERQRSDSALAIVRDRNNAVIPLAGQASFPEAFAKVYVNQQTQAVYVDAAGLPQPPEGMVYQVWALKLNPLTPTSIGLLDEFTKNRQRIFSVESFPEAQAYGITLEPAGGSQTPTMEQLYTLGTVGNS